MVDEEIGMPAKRELSMRQLRHLLRLRHDGVSAREIGRRLGVSRSTIQDNLKRAAARAGVGGPGARAEASWRHDDDPVGGIPGGPSRGLWLQPLLRSASWVRA